MADDMPLSVLVRMAKKATDGNARLNSDAKATIQKSVRVFIHQLTACAQEHAASAKRKRIMEKDVLSALKEIDFEYFNEPLSECLVGYRESVAAKKATRKSRADGDVPPNETGEGEGKGDAEVEDEGEGDRDSEGESEDDVGDEGAQKDAMEVESVGDDDTAAGDANGK
eukprot:TRINITY_DN8997_c0_g1_i1.p1 TRINITY_DN8997_c0_g1~~TRINITY_DN8997_c0_g1_i1.p1  ORF type:complete len:193 (-),score=61.05 TRINITY_DN8997_c0_g1_i1:227-733(-)